MEWSPWFALTLHAIEIASYRHHDVIIIMVAMMIMATNNWYDAEFVITGDASDRRYNKSSATSNGKPGIMSSLGFQWNGVLNNNTIKFQYFTFSIIPYGTG